MSDLKKAPKQVYLNPNQFNEHMDPVGFKEFKAFQARDTKAEGLVGYVRQDIYDKLVEMLADRGIDAESY